MELAQSLRAKGYRLTPQRQLVLEAVQELGHATPEDVHAWVRQRAEGVNVSTVYRTLELLEELELVTHTHLSHGAPTYHPAGEADHAHLVCHTCGSVKELDSDELRSLVRTVRDRTGFVPDIGHLTVFGECERCSP
ncbi:MAG: Fur family transcriptional regulator [Nocardioidaceae bacterium]